MSGLWLVAALAGIVLAVVVAIAWPGVAFSLFVVLILAIAIAILTLADYTPKDQP